MSVLTITGLSHVYDNKILFDKADLSINNGEHAGIVGLNGAGKSTFMNILTGRILQDSGEVKWQNGVTWGYLDQYLDIDRSLTVMEYLKSSFAHLYAKNEKMEELYARVATETDADVMDQLIRRAGNIMDELTQANFFDLEAEIKKVANGLGVGAIGYETPVSRLSGGQREKLMLAKLLLTAPDVLLLDEPTNFLDTEHIDWLAKYLNAFQGTFLLISHDAGFLNAVCKLIVNIENGEIRRYTGNYDLFLSQQESNRKQYAENYNRQQREIKKMEDYIARNKARAATAGMANSRKKQLEKIEVMNKPLSIPEATFAFRYTPLVTKDLLDVKNLEIGYGSPLLPPLNLHLTCDSKLWIRGTNGIGKSTLLKTLLGQLKPVGGSFRFHPAVKIGYLEQEIEFPGGVSNALGFLNLRYPRKNQKELRAELAKVGIRNEMSLRPLHELSGGEQIRVRLCAMEHTESNVLILDEPTNHLDVVAKEALKKALSAYEGAILLVSHEADFAEDVCNDVFDVKV